MSLVALPLDYSQSQEKIPSSYPCSPGLSAGGMSVAVPDKPLMLLNGRAFGDKVRSTEQSTEGAVVWIEAVLPDAAPE